MPTLSNDVQAVLATDKVRFQGQEVAFVVAEDRYSARDALELIDVEYDDPRSGDRRAEGARTRCAGHPRRPRGQDRQPLLRLGDRRRGRHQRGVRVGRGGDGGQDIVYPRVHPAPMETCGCVADFEQGGRQAHPLDDLAGPPRAPHGVRAGVGSARAQDPRHRPRHRRRVRQQGADLPGLRVRDRRLARHRQAGEVDGGPHREPREHRLRARLRHARRDRRHQGRQDPRHPHERARRPRRLQRHRGADQVPGRVLRRVHRQLRPAGGPLQDDRRLHEQGARRRGLRLLVPHHRGRVPGRAARRLPGVRPRDGPRRAADQELHPARPVPLHVEDRVGVRLRQLRAGHAHGHGDGRLRRAASRAGGEAGQGRAHGHRRRVLHRGRRRRAAQGHGHPRPRHGRRQRAARPPHRQGGSCGCRA